MNSQGPIEIVIARCACFLLELKNLCTTNEVDLYSPNAKVIDAIH
jgi:hypothetical protein